MKKSASNSSLVILGLCALSPVSVWAASTPCPPDDASTAPISASQVQDITKIAGTSSAAADKVFDKLFPYYTVECSESRGLKNATPKLDAAGKPMIGPDGKPLMNPAEEYGPFGHSVMYLKGICRDTSVDYPKIKMCDPAKTDLTNPDSGVGLSVDKIFSNTKFIVIDGKDAMFSGNLKPDQPLNQTTFDQTVKDILATGATQGIKVNDLDMSKKPAGMSDQDYISQHVAAAGADTDFALQFARESSCVKIPMDKAHMQAEVDEANKENEPYTLHGKINHWKGPSNSCVDFNSQYFNCGRLWKRSLA